MKIVILAAGMGSRLGMPFPKCLTKLNDEDSILGLQLKAFSQYQHDVIVVVGYKKELIMEAFPDLYYVYNPQFDTTNTSKSLLKALSKIHDEDVLWINGDVVFDAEILPGLLSQPSSVISVNTSSVGEEEVKYIVDQEGRILELSKKVSSGLGEAVGINVVRRHDLPSLKQSLIKCEEQDYFERGVEISIAEGAVYKPFDISKYSCVEVDFQEDLNRARQIVHSLS